VLACAIWRVAFLAAAAMDVKLIINFS